MALSEQQLAEAIAVHEALGCKRPACVCRLHELNDGDSSIVLQGWATDGLGKTRAWLRLAPADGHWCWVDSNFKSGKLQSGDPRLLEMIRTFVARSSSRGYKLGRAMFWRNDEPSTTIFFDNHQADYARHRAVLRQSARLYRQAFGSKWSKLWRVRPVLGPLVLICLSLAVAAVLTHGPAAALPIALVGCAATALDHLLWVLRHVGASVSDLTHAVQCGCDVCLRSRARLAPQSASEIRQYALSSLRRAGVLVYPCFTLAAFVYLEKLLGLDRGLQQSLAVLGAGYLLSIAIFFVVSMILSWCFDAHKTEPPDISNPGTRRAVLCVAPLWCPMLVIGLATSDTLAALCLGWAALGTFNATVLAATFVSSAGAYRYIQATVFAPVLQQASVVAAIGYVLGGDRGAENCIQQLADHMTDLQNARANGRVAVWKLRLSNILAWLVCFVVIFAQSVADIAAASIGGLLGLLWPRPSQE